MPIVLTPHVLMRPAGVRTRVPSCFHGTRLLASTKNSRSDFLLRTARNSFYSMVAGNGQKILFNSRGSLIVGYATSMNQ